MSQQQIARPQAAAVLRLKAAVEAGQGMLLVTAEYNPSVTGLLNNAIGRCCAARSRSRWR